MKSLKYLVVALTTLLFSPVFADAEERHYLFIGEPSPEGWRWLMKNPGDRKAVAEAGIEKLGGELLSYYWGANDGKNYIIVRLPADNETVPAMLVMRLSSGLLSSYKAIELIPSEQMPIIMERISDIMAVDDIQADDAKEE